MMAQVCICPEMPTITVLAIFWLCLASPAFVTVADLQSKRLWGHYQDHRGNFCTMPQLLPDRAAPLFYLPLNHMAACNCKANHLVKHCSITLIAQGVFICLLNSLKMRRTQSMDHLGYLVQQCFLFPTVSEAVHSTLELYPAWAYCFLRRCSFHLHPRLPNH